MKIEVLRRAFRGQQFSAQDAGRVWGIRNPYSTLNRLKQTGVLESVARGQYQIAPDQTLQRLGDRLEQQALQTLRNQRDSELARLAKQRWADWLASGQVRRSGPRRYRFQVRQPQGGGVVVRRLS